jgi:integrase
LKKINGKTLYDKKDGSVKSIKRGLNTIGEAVGVTGLTSYVFRHTWATIAARLDLPKETISKALGHGRKSVTDIYIDFDQSKVDEANRKVIDYVFNQNIIS